MSGTLSLDEIDILLSTAKTRGEYKPVLINFFTEPEIGEDGEVVSEHQLYLNLSERFPGKDAQSLRNSVNIRLKQDDEFKGKDYKLTIVGKDEDAVVLLVNMQEYAIRKQAENDAKNDAADEETSD